ncbi:CheR family methyltransferase [Porticoccus sp. GXU_MW_L64]
MMSTSSVQRTRSGFDHRQAQLWQQLLERRTGVRADSLNLDRLAAGIGALADELGFVDTMDFYRQLAAGEDNHPQWTQLLDRVLVRDTRFLRHRESMDAVGRIWQAYQQRQDNITGSSFTAWSVGCSSGEETYSLALVLADHCLDQRVSYGVIGMDISAQAIATARNGIYSPTQLSALSQRQRDHYFQCRNTGYYPNGFYQVGEQLRRRTCFIRGNALQVADSSQQVPQLQGADLIYCQNMLPYFRRWQRQQLVTSLVASLKPGGHLLVGPGELANWQPPQVERVAQPSVQMYRRNTSISASAGVLRPAPTRIR